MHTNESEAMISQTYYNPVIIGRHYKYVSSNTGNENQDRLMKKSLRLCVFGILLPISLILIPLHLRFKVFTKQLYPLALSDIRILDEKMSTIWCQKQIIRVNTTFNAYLINETPKLSTKSKKLTMLRQLQLGNDMKEYWSFYLLKGSAITVSSCSRWPGASLVAISGHKHLHQCAFIGDDSSEEKRDLIDQFKGMKIPNDSDSRDESTETGFLKKFIPGVKFHDLSHYDSNLDNNSENESKLSNSLEDLDPQLIQKLYEQNHKKDLNYDLMNNKDKRLYNDIVKKLQIFQHQKKLKDFNQLIDSFINNRKRDIQIAELNENDEKNNQGGEIDDNNFKSFISHHGTITKTALSNDQSHSEYWSSFSSSEENLLNCPGLILSLPLTPKRDCTTKSNYTDSEFEQIARINTISYTIPKTGYYFFLLNSENEVQVNDIVIKFQVEKMVYNLSQIVRKAINVTNGTYDMPLTFFSNEKLVLEIPMVSANPTILSANNVLSVSDIDHDFIVWSECEPRGTLYVILLISVPVLIVMFAFH